jgi:hypothetical protein
MLGIKTRLPIGAAEAEMIYAKLTALRGLFPELDFRSFPSLIPDRALKEIRFDGTEEACQRLGASIQAVMGIEGGIETFFENREDAEDAAREAARRTPSEGHWESRGIAGIYYRPASGDSGQEPAQVAIDLKRFVGSPPESLAATIAHEYAHHKLLHDKGLSQNDEEATDLLPILFGYGIFMANAAFGYKTAGEVNGPMAWHSWQFSSSGYLPVGLVAFAHAIVSAWKGEASARAGIGLSATAGDFYAKGRRFLESRRLAPWSGEPDCLTAWLRQETLADAPSPTEGERQVEARVKWRGTFDGEPQLIDGSSCIADPASLLDFGEGRREIQVEGDRAFGLAYSIHDHGNEEEIVIEELLYPPRELPEEDREPFGLRHRLKPGVLTRFICVAGVPPCDRPGACAMELRFEGRVLRREAFELMKGKRAEAE